jgi:hypothetical protein
MLSNLGTRSCRRGALAILMSLALVFVIMASADTPADARRVRHKRSVSSEFIGPSEFTCYWVDGAAQYFCQEKRSDKTASPPIGFPLEPGNPVDPGLSASENPPENADAEKFVTPRGFSCSLEENADPKNPANYSCAYWYDKGKRTFPFTLDKAMAIIVEDDKTKEIFIDTWFIPRHQKDK